MSFKKLILSVALGAVLSTPIHAQTNKVRTLTLQESIQLALQNNLDVRIEQFGPRIAQFDLAGVYGAYDPVFTTRAVRSFRSSPGGIDAATGLQKPPSERDIDSYDLGLSGKLPT